MVNADGGSENTDSLHCFRCYIKDALPGQIVSLICVVLDAIH